VSYTSLLQRQLRKQFGENFTPDGPMADFLDWVDDAYRGYEEDQRMLERSLEISSSELNELNERLLQQLKQGERVQERLLRSQEKFRLLAENLQETVFRLSPGGFLQYVSQSILTLTGYTAEEMIGVSPVILFENEADFQNASRRFRQIRDQKKHHQIVFRLKRKDHTVIYAEMAGTPLDRGGKVVAIQGTIRDITERYKYENDLKLAKEAAENATRVKSTFISTISHEIRTPLHCILGFAELVNSMNPPAGIRPILDSILNESSHLLALINMLLDHAKIEADKLELVLMPFELHKLCHKMVPSMRSMARLKALQISVYVDERVPAWVVGDSTRIRQILNNIAGNAVKFTHEGSVRLDVRERSREGNTSHIEFKVTDTGVGIPANKLQSVFDSFTQVDGRISRKYGGTGLGTTITKQLAHLMNGTVQLESTEGIGTSFSVSLPLTIATEEQITEFTQSNSAVETRQTQHNPSIFRILVAEDNENSQMLLRLHLESVGYRVEVTDDGATAVERFQKGKFHLFLTDIQMPRMDGFEAAKTIRSMEPSGQRIPIVAMTANADSPTRQLCFEAGMNDVMTKPMGRKKLLSTTARWLNTIEALPAEKQRETAEGELQNDACSSKERHDIFCYKDALEAFVGNKKLLKGAILHFLQTAERDAQEMSLAHENAAFDTVRKIAHKLRGASANITATRLQRIAGLIETKIITENPPYDLDDLLAEWRTNWELFMEKLTQDPQFNAAPELKGANE
jgi:PAS domain S-box-containing protein